MYYIQIMIFTLKTCNYTIRKTPLKKLYINNNKILKNYIYQSNIQTCSTHVV